jgi:hypothetical protein
VLALGVADLIDAQILDSYHQLRWDQIRPSWDSTCLACLALGLYFHARTKLLGQNHSRRLTSAHLVDMAYSSPFRSFLAVVFRTSTTSAWPLAW